MPMTPRTLLCIPARGGSKGLPGKNVRPCAGKPLIAYAIAAALEVADRVHRTIVSTDDDEIARVARSYGAEVPFLRPAELATDKATSAGVAWHALLRIEEEDACRLDGVLLLQATNPTVVAEDIAAVLSRADAGDVDSVVTASADPHHHPAKAKRLADGLLEPWDGRAEPDRRQDLGATPWFRNGSCYWSSRATLAKGQVYGERTAAVEVPRTRCIDIDDEDDLLMAEAVLLHVREYGDRQSELRP